MPEKSPFDICFHQLTDGRQLAFRKVGQGPPLVMLHGWSMSGAVFSEVAAALSRDFLVICPDLCGHGYSDAAADYSLDLFVADVSELLHSLGILQSAFLGWSLGGQVAMCLAAQHRSLVSRLMLISSTPCFCQNEGWLHGLPETQVRTMSRQLKRNYLKTLSDFFALQFADEQMSAERRRELLAFSVRASRLPNAEDCIATLNILATADIRVLTGDIECPTIVMHGTKDRIIPCDAGLYLANEIPDAQLLMFEGVGHAPFLSRPEEFIETLKGFLQ